LNAQTDFVYGDQVWIHGHMMTRFTRSTSCQNLYSHHSKLLAKKLKSHLLRKLKHKNLKHSFL